MGRILAIDYGTKKTGLAVTDPLQIIASILETIPTTNLLDYIEKYCQEETVDKIIVGEPLYPDGNPAQIHHLVVGFVRKLQKKYPETPIILEDERFTSMEAKQIILQSGAKKRKRKDKTLVDKVSASLILRSYMEREVW